MDGNHAGQPAAAEWELLRRRFAGRGSGLLGAKHEYAVLIPLIEDGDGLRLLFEVRAAGIRQGGETCFPGGRMEAGETEAECALRETEEELSIPRGQIRVMGKTDFICGPRGFLLRPVLGAVSAAGLSALRPSPAEVREAFSVPLRFFRETAPAVYAYDLIPVPPPEFPYEAVGIPAAYPWPRGRVEVPVWYWRGRAIWGMTARIVRELIAPP